MHLAGDPGQRLCIRSALKPFVVALVVGSGAVDAFGIDDVGPSLIAGSPGGRGIP